MSYACRIALAETLAMLVANLTRLLREPPQLFRLSLATSAAIGSSAIRRTAGSSPLLLSMGSPTTSVLYNPARADVCNWTRRHLRYPAEQSYACVDVQNQGDARSWRGEFPAAATHDGRECADREDVVAQRRCRRRRGQQRTFEGRLERGRVAGRYVPSVHRSPRGASGVHSSGLQQAANPWLGAGRDAHCLGSRWSRRRIRG